MRLNDCEEDHWENMKRLIASEAKKNEATNNRAMWVLVSTPSHSNRGGKIKVVG
jgi:hypothetical protein